MAVSLYLFAFTVFVALVVASRINNEAAFSSDDEQCVLQKQAFRSKMIDLIRARGMSYTSSYLLSSTFNPLEFESYFGYVLSEQARMALWSGKANLESSWEETRRELNLKVLDHDGEGGRSYTSFGGQAMWAAHGLEACRDVSACGGGDCSMWKQRMWRKISQQFAMVSHEAEKHIDQYGVSFTKTEILVLVGDQFGAKRSPEESTLCKAEMPEVMNFRGQERDTTFVVVTKTTRFTCMELARLLASCATHRGTIWDDRGRVVGPFEAQFKVRCSTCDPETPFSVCVHAMDLKIAHETRYSEMIHVDPWSARRAFEKNMDARGLGRDKFKETRNRPGRFSEIEDY